MILLKNQIAPLLSANGSCRQACVIDKSFEGTIHEPDQKQLAIRQSS